jgi:HK97 family phage prohead protease
MLYKSAGLHVKDLDPKQGVISMYWSAFNNQDDGGDAVRPGAFRKSIGEWGPRSRQPRIKWLYQHDSSQLLGVPSELVEDDFGLLATAQIVKTALGQDVLLLYEAGVITEHSIGYETVLATFDKGRRTRWLEEVKLFEGSSVTWGMNSQTPTVAVKSLTDAAALADRQGRLHKLLHDAPLRTESMAARLEDELKAIDALLARLDRAPAPARPAEILGGRAALDALATTLAGTPAEGKAADMPKDIPMPAKPARPAKGRDFETVYTTDRDAWDLLEDLDDMMEALKEAIVSGLVEGSGDTTNGDEDTIKTSLSQFSARVLAWVEASAIQSCWAEIADAAEEASDRTTDRLGSSYGYWGYMSLIRERAEAKGVQLPPLAATPVAPGEVKKGAALSGSNRDRLTAVANGLASAMKDMGTHHKALKALLEETAPKDKEDDTDATGNTGRDAAGEDDDGKNGSAPDRAAKAGAGTTRDGDGIGLADLIAALETVRRPAASDAK